MRTPAIVVVTASNSGGGDWKHGLPAGCVAQVQQNGQRQEGGLFLSGQIGFREVY